MSSSFGHSQSIAKLRIREAKYAEAIGSSDRLDQFGAGGFYMGRLSSKILLPEPEWHVLDYILNNYPVSSTIVEIGCGWAQMLAMASTLGYSAIGLDVAGGRIEGAKYLRDIVEVDYPGAARRLHYFIEEFPKNWPQGLSKLSEIRGGPVIGFFSNLGVGAPEEFCEACVAEFGRFDYVIMDVVRFFRDRLDERDQNHFIQRMDEAGVKYLTDIYLRPGAYRFIALAVDQTKLLTDRGAAGAMEASSNGVFAWIDSVRKEGGTVSPDRAVLIDRLVRALDECGAWQKLDRLWVFAAENEVQALTDLVGSGRANAIGEPAFSIDQGYSFNGVDQYIDTTFNATAPFAKYSLNSASFGGFIFDGAKRAGGIEFGNDFGGYSMLISNSGDHSRRLQINAATDLTHFPNQGALTGHFHAQRTSSEHTELYVDGVAQGATSDRSYLVPNQTFAVGAGKGSGGACHFSTASISTAHIGCSFLSADQIERFDKVIRSFLRHVDTLPK